MVHNLSLMLSFYYIHHHIQIFLCMLTLHLTRPPEGVCSRLLSMVQEVLPWGWISIRSSLTQRWFGDSSIREDGDFTVICKCNGDGL